MENASHPLRGSVKISGVAGTFSRCFLLAAILAAGSGGSFAYSVLTHEAIIDSAWEDLLKPALKSRFPGLTASQLIEAHSYAYGGAIIQDMGYYPFGSKQFSDLVHYVRSGDFVLALLREAQQPDELAFALGALAHYAADNSGHPNAINHAVPMIYPKLRRKFGDPVTYEDDPGAHMKTEFGFDVLEVAQGRYAPSAYHDFIGFRVAKPLLERAFEDVYSIPLKALFKDLDLALGSYRFAIKSLIPEMTKAAWNSRKDQIGASIHGITRSQFVFNISRSSFEKEWGRSYERPGFGARTLALLFRFIPKVGPLRALGFRVPTPAAEKLFMASFNQTLTRYREFEREWQANRLRLPDRNLDTGQDSSEGTYRLADKTYADLLEKLADHKSPVAPELRRSILAFFVKPSPALSKKAQAEYDLLRKM